MKKRTVILLTAIVAAALTACGGSGGSGEKEQEPASTAAVAAETAESAETAETTESNESTESEESEIEMPLEVEKDEEVFGVTDNTESMDMANPFVTCTNMEAAEKLAGFSMKTISDIEGYEEDAIRVIPGELIEIIYKNADDKEIRLRKGTGTEDISGDYNSYESEETKEIGGVTVTEKSSADGIHLATWTQDDHAGALTSEEGLPAEKAEELLAQVF